VRKGTYLIPLKAKQELIVGAQKQSKAWVIQAEGKPRQKEDSFVDEELDAKAEASVQKLIATLEKEEKARKELLRAQRGSKGPKNIEYVFATKIPKKVRPEDDPDNEQTEMDKLILQLKRSTTDLKQIYQKEVYPNEASEAS